MIKYSIALSGLLKAALRAFFASSLPKPIAQISSIVFSSLSPIKTELADSWSNDWAGAGLDEEGAWEGEEDAGFLKELTLKNIVKRQKKKREKDQKKYVVWY